MSLGDTLEQIAAGKGGNASRPVGGRLSSAGCRPWPNGVIRGIANRLAAPVLTVAGEFGEDLAAYPRTNFEGDYQRWNAATAALAARQLPPKWRIDEAVVARGLREWTGPDAGRG